MSRPPRGQHHQLLPGLPRHYPHCTSRRRGEEGCECSMYYHYGLPKPTARLYRRTRRCVRRSWHASDMQQKRHGIPPQHNHTRALGDPEPVAGGWACWHLPCPDGCPAKGFVYARDWPPTVTSWKGLTR